MKAAAPSDGAMIQRLPLPLAQLYRDAQNAFDPLALHQTGYYLWETTVRLLAVVALVDYSRSSEQNRYVRSTFGRTGSPSLGQWLGIVRELVPQLLNRSPRKTDFTNAEEQSASLVTEGYRKIARVLRETQLRNLPQTAKLEQELRTNGSEDASSGQKVSVSPRSSARLLDVFDRLVSYRNRVIGHGAIGNHPASHYERIGSAMLSAMTEILGCLDPLADQRLIHVAEVRQRAGNWEVVYFELTGEVPHRLPPWQGPIESVSKLPAVDRVYLALPDTADSALDPTTLIPLHPLLSYDPERKEVLFLNASRGKNRLEYLCYNDSRIVERTDTEGAFPQFLSRMVGEEITRNDEEVESGELPHASSGSVRRNSIRAVLALLLVGLLSLAIVGLIRFFPRRNNVDPVVGSKTVKHSGREAPDKPRVSPVRMLTPEMEVLAVPELMAGIGDVCDRLSQVLRDNKLKEVRVSGFAGPPSFEGGSPAIKQPFLDVLKERGILSRTSTTRLKGKYFALYDEENQLLTLGIQTSLWQGDTLLRELPTLSVNDRPFLARTLGLTQTDGGAGQSPEKQTLLLREDLDKPSTDVREARIRSGPKSPYALEIHVREKAGEKYWPQKAEVRGGQAYLPTPQPNDVFAINLINGSDYDAAVEVTLDGLNLFSFYEKPNFRYLIVPRHSNLLLKGWPTKPSRGTEKGSSDRFVFTEYAKSAVAELKADRSKIGMITVSFAAAWEKEDDAPKDDRGVGRSDIAVGREGPVETPSKEVRMYRGRDRDTITVRYLHPETK